MLTNEIGIPFKLSTETKEMKAMKEATPSYYKKIFNGVLLDPYRVLKVYGITDPAHQHAVKKLLRAGESLKDLKQDVQEVIDTLTRMLQMIDEESEEITEPFPGHALGCPCKPCRIRHDSFKL